MLIIVNSQVRSDVTVTLKCDLQRIFNYKNAMLVKLIGRNTYMNMESNMIQIWKFESVEMV